MTVRECKMVQRWLIDLLFLLLLSVDNSVVRTGQSEGAGEYVRALLLQRGKERAEVRRRLSKYHIH